MHQPRQSWLPTADEPGAMASQVKAFDDTIAILPDMMDVIQEGLDEDPALIYEALDQTFTWREGYREKLENAHNELIRLKRQVEAKGEALEKLKAGSTVKETQAEIYRLEQDAYEEARKLKERDSAVGSQKAQSVRLQSMCEELENYEPSRSGDFKVDDSMLKTKLYHGLGFVQVRHRSKSDSTDQKLILRCDLHPESSQVIHKADNNRDGFILSNRLWDLISP